MAPTSLPIGVTGPPLFFAMKQDITIETTTTNIAAEGGGSSSSTSTSSSSVSQKIRVGQLFKSRQEFTTAVRLQLMGEGKGWKVDKGGARQAGVRCAGHDQDPNTKVHGGCGFRITVCKQTRGRGGSKTDSISDQLTWKVTSVVDEHVNCSGKGPPRRPGLAEIRAAGHPIISNNPKIRAPTLQKMIKAQTGIDVHVRTANRLIKHANSDAMLSLAQERAAGFQHLGSYLEKLAENSGGTITDVKWTEDGHFDKCFVMLGQSAYMAVCSPHQAFSIDCSHLKGYWDGVLMCVMLTLKDADDKPVIVAFAVGPVENADDVYRYMLGNVKRNKEMEAWMDKETTTCYFKDDPAVAMEGVIAAEVPRVEPRRCLSDLISCIAQKLDKECTKYVFDAATAPSSASFHYHLDRLKDFKPASYDALMKHPHASWANYACRRNVTWDQVTTNMMTSEESANDVIGKELLAKPVFEIVKGVVELVATRLHEASQLRIDRPEEMFTPFAEGRLSAELSCSHEFSIKTTAPGIHMVAPFLSKSRLEHRVGIDWGDSSNVKGGKAPSMKCTCGYPERWEMPCRHVLAVCLATNKLDKARALIPDGFKLTNYRAAAFTPAFAVSTPVWSELTRDASRKEPSPNLRLHPANQPKKKRDRKKAKSIGVPTAVVTSSTSKKCRVSLDPRPSLNGATSKGAGSGSATVSESVEVLTKASVAVGSSVDEKPLCRFEDKEELSRGFPNSEAGGM